MEKLNRTINFLFSNYKNHNFNLLKSLYRGDLLRYYGLSEDVACAGYLLDLVKSNLFTVDEIARIFGGTVSSNLLTGNFDYNVNDKQLTKYLDSLTDKTKNFITADLLANYVFGELSLIHFRRIASILAEDFYSPLFSCVVKEIFGENVFVESKNLKSLKKVFEEKSPYVVMIGDDAGEMSIDDIIESFFAVSFKLRIGGALGSSVDIRNTLIHLALDGRELYQILNGNNVFMIEDGVYDRLVWFKLLVNNEELLLRDINKYVKNTLRTMNDSVIISGVSLFSDGADYFEEVPDSLKDMLIDGKPEEMTMSVVNTFLPIMSKQYLLNLKNKISR